MSSKVGPLNERLREVPHAKMMMDVVKVHGNNSALQLRKAVQFVCGNTLVCETIKEARSVAFNGPERHKVNWSLSPHIAVTSTQPQLNALFYSLMLIDTLTVC